MANIFPQDYPYPDKSVPTSNVETQDALCPGTPHVGCVQSVLLVSWESLLFVHIYLLISVYLSIYLAIYTNIYTCLYI